MVEVEGAEGGYRELDVDVLPLVLQLLQTCEKLLHIVVCDRVVFAVGNVGWRLGDGGCLDVLRRLVIRGDALSAGATGDKSRSRRRKGKSRRRMRNGRRNRKARESCARNAGSLQAAGSDPGKPGNTRARHGCEFELVQKEIRGLDLEIKRVPEETLKPVYD